MVAHPSRWRIAVVAVVLFLAFFLLIAQLVRWMVIDPAFPPEPETPAEASDRYQRRPERGMILDIQGELLAFDTYTWEVWVEPRLVSVPAIDIHRPGVRTVVVVIFVSSNEQHIAGDRN